MGDRSPKAGYTKSGKSLKAVRRYYALKDASRRKRSPANTEDEEDKRREERARQNSARKRTPDDDKLSKRIAAELKLHQEVNAKRAGQYELISPTERSAMPAMSQQFGNRAGGPTFVTEPVTSPESPRSPKSTKSAKSVRSIGTIARIAENPEAFTHNIGTSSLGCVLTCLILAFVYIITWLFMLISEKSRLDQPEPQLAAYSSMKSIRWLAITSIVVLIAIPYWFLERNHFKHALISLALMIISTLSVSTYLVYTAVTEAKSSDDKPGLLWIRNPLNFWLPITYLVFHLITSGFMIKQLMNLVSKQMGEKSTGRGQVDDQAQISMLFAPKV